MMDNKTPEFSLTLDPFAASAAAAPVPGTAKQEAPAPAKEEQLPFLDESAFTEAEQNMINEFSQKIDVSDSAMVLTYGSVAQKKISDFSDSALGSVRNKDFGETGEMITNLIAELKGMNEDADDNGFLGLFKNTKRKIENLKIKYDKCEDSVNSIVAVLEQHQITLLKDISMFDELYEMNLNYFKELS
ncbi:MAG: toxic anion resistance protein, partial [Lentisphaeria bacterium]|nr:toxic anion resistance protein [Lentisphaeria bacterium]